MATRVSPLSVRRHIRSRLSELLGADLQAAYLFGSRARETANDESDWDVLVFLSDTTDYETARGKLRRMSGAMIDEIGEHVSVLALRWSDANDHQGLLANVAREGKRL